MRIKAVVINEEVMIPPELANQYLTVKKQMADKQSKKDNLMKAVNQTDNEMNILNKNLIAIETKAAQMTGQEEQQVAKNKQEAAENAQKQAEVSMTSESLDLDERWKNYILEGDTQDLDDFMNNTGDWEVDAEIDVDPDVETELLDEPLKPEEGESLEGDYVFTLKVKSDLDEEDIIAKFYKNEDDEYWRVRVVQGEEKPLEDMKFDPDLESLDIMEKVAEIPGYSEVEEMETQEYQDLIDDKEILDNFYYDDIIKEK